MPPAWDAAPLTFLTSFDGVDWHDLFHADPTTTGLWESAGGKPEQCPSAAADGRRQSRLAQDRSGTRSAPIKQSGDRTFRLMLEAAA
jgi:hypothetical protein